MEGIKERLEELIKYLKVSPAEFARECSIDKQSIYNYMSGKNISTKNYNKILTRYQEINEVWLYTGRGPMLNKASSLKFDETMDLISTVKVLDHLKTRLEQMEVDIKEMRMTIDDFMQNAIKNSKKALDQIDKR